MTENKIKSILNKFDKSLKDIVPKNKNNINNIHYNLQLVFDDLLFYESNRLNNYKKSKVDLDSIIKLVQTGIIHLKQKDIESLLFTLIYINDTLIDIKTHIQNLRVEFRKLIFSIDKHYIKKDKN